MLEVVTKTCQEVNCDDFHPPSKISPMNALEDHIHIKTESRRWRGSGWTTDTVNIKIKVMEWI